jgi:hypothetical protein
MSSEVRLASIQYQEIIFFRNDSFITPRKIQKFSATHIGHLSTVSLKLTKKQKFHS